MLALATPALAGFTGPALMPQVSMPEISMMAKRPAKKGSYGSAAKAPKPRNVRKAGVAIDVVTGKPFQDVKTESVWSSAAYDEIGVLPPIGRWDPLEIRAQGPERYRRFVEMEIKHGRMAMAAVVGVLTTYSGARLPGYLSKSADLKFEDMPGTMIGSWESVPIWGWGQIILFIMFLEAKGFKQDPNKDAGDVVPDNVPWARYPDGYTVPLGDGSSLEVSNPARDSTAHARKRSEQADNENTQASPCRPCPPF